MRIGAGCGGNEASGCCGSGAREWNAAWHIDMKPAACGERIRGATKMFGSGCSFRSERSTYRWSCGRNRERAHREGWRRREGLWMRWRKLSGCSWGASGLARSACEARGRNIAFHRPRRPCVFTRAAPLENRHFRHRLLGGRCAGSGPDPGRTTSTGLGSRRTPYSCFFGFAENG